MANNNHQMDMFDLKELNHLIHEDFFDIDQFEDMYKQTILLNMSTIISITT